MFLWWNVNPGYTSHETFLLNETTGRELRKQASLPEVTSVLNLNTTNPGTASALALFVATILADDPHHTLAADDLAVATNTFYGRTNFHGFT
jgi:hypothetical protein